LRDKVFSFFPWDLCGFSHLSIISFNVLVWSKCIQNNFYLIFSTIYSPSFLILSTLSFVTTIVPSFQPVYKNLKQYFTARLKTLQLLLYLPISTSAIIQTANLNILKTFILSFNLIN
jgi:hypothetical protein